MTRDLFCCCPPCFSSDFKNCQYLSETGAFVPRTFKVRPPPKPKKKKADLVIGVGPPLADALPRVDDPALEEPAVAVAAAVDGEEKEEVDDEGQEDDGEGREDDDEGQADDEEITKCNWIQCSKRKCTKWRRLADGDDGEWAKIARRWKCSDNDWDLRFNQCEFDEEIYNYQIITKFVHKYNLEMCTHTTYSTIFPISA